VAAKRKFGEESASGHPPRSTAVRPTRPHPRHQCRGARRNLDRTALRMGDRGPYGRSQSGSWL